MVREIANTDGLYSVTDDGRVYSRYIGRYLKPRVHATGYHRVALVVHGNRREAAVHRLVAEAFIPNRNNASQVNHRDGVKSNNTIENLEWCTATENMRHASLNKLKAVGERHGLSKLTDKDIREIRRVADRSSLKSLARSYGVAPGTVKSVITGKTWKHVI